MTSLDGHRDGDTYEAEFDYTRLNRQMRLVYTVLKTGAWWTRHDIADVTKQPESSVSARIRDLRKAKFGGFTVERKRHSLIPGLFLYRLIQPERRAA